MKINKNKIYTIILILVFCVLLFFRLNNALNYNCYWGYDGASHIEYIYTIEDQYRLPTFDENYLAWHEPLYYFIFAIFGSLYKFISGNSEFFSMIKFLQVLTAFVDIFFLFVFYKTLGYLTKNRKVKLATLLSVGFFTPLIIVNNYLTNELFLYWLIILCFYFVVRFNKFGWSYKKALLIGVLSAFVLLTKLSALIFIFSLCVWFLYQAFYFKNKKFIYYLGLVILIVFVLNLPWQIYRAKNFGGIFTVNNYELLQEGQLSQTKDVPGNFFTNFNFEIFKNPFWQSSRNSFWSIIFAQIFVDYDNIGGNVDLNNSTKEIMTGNGRFVNSKNFILSRASLVIGIFVSIILILGFLREIAKFIKRRFRPDIKSLFIVFIFLSFFALVYNVIKNPFIERGTLKIIFILSVWPFLFFLGYKNLDEILHTNKLKFLWLFVWVIIVAYSYLSININWVPNF